MSSSASIAARLAAGDAIYIPAGHPHGTHNPTGEPAVLLAIYGHETSYGLVTGSHDLLQVLASLGYAPERIAAMREVGAI